MSLFSRTSKKRNTKAHSSDVDEASVAVADATQSDRADLSVPQLSEPQTSAAELLTHSIEDSDELLLTHYRQTGDRVAFETLMRRYEREIYSYLRRYNWQR